LIDSKIKKEICFYLPENQMRVIIGPKFINLKKLEDLSKTRIRLIRNKNNLSIGFSVFCYKKSIDMIIKFLNTQFNLSYK
jgi:hypothetical protein